MQRQTFWNDVISPLFPKESLELLVETSQGRVREVNLDNAATTIPFRAVLESIQRFLETYGSIHRGAGYRSVVSTDQYEQARERIRIFLGASVQNYVVFTKNTTEAINEAAALWKERKGKVLVSDIEHSSNLLPWLTTQEIIQYQTERDGTFTLDDVGAVFRKHDDIKLLAITGSSNVTGYKPPIHDLASLAHTYGAQILVDACQLVQHEQVHMLADEDPQHLDFVVFSGHKMYAPYGTGVLIGPKPFFDQSMPYQIGGGNLTYISRNLELRKAAKVQTHDPGTPNALGAIAIAAAADVLNTVGYDAINAYESGLVQSAFTQLKRIPRVSLYVPEQHLGSVLSFDIEGIPAKSVAQRLREEYGIGVRAGSFCTYELLRKLKGITDAEDRQIVEAIDRGDASFIPSVVRASFGLVNQEQDVERFCEAIYDISRQ